MKKLEIIGNFIYILSALFLIWGLASWIDLVSDMTDMTRTYEWWNIVHVWDWLAKLIK